MKRSFKVHLRNIIVTGVAVPLMACGPMNSKPPPKAVSGASDSQAVTKLAQTKNGNFLVFTTLTAPKKGPVLGDNTYVIRFVRSGDGSYPDKNAEVEGQCSRAASAIHKPHKLKFTRLDDGAYQTVISVKKAGDWDISLKIKDRGVEDDFVFEMSL